MTTNALGPLTDLYFTLTAKKKAAEELATELSKQIADVEHSIIEACDAQGLTQVANASGVLRVSESVVPAVSDWDAYYAFIHENKYYHLLERRPSITGCRELFEQGNRIPGVQPFVKRVLRRKKA